MSNKEESQIFNMKEEEEKSKLKRLFKFLSNITHKKSEINIGLRISEKRKFSKLLSDCLTSIGGEVAARERAAAIGQTYLELNKEGKKEFLMLLSSLEFPKLEIMKEFQKVCSSVECGNLNEESIYNLKKLLKSPRVKILRQFNFLEEGLNLLVEMRKDLLTFIEEGETSLNFLDNDFEDLLSSWFDVGFLELESITWDSSASLLNKLIAYEAVHKINSWKDLENRLDVDRRCYAFFHPSMKKEPLIFIEVALVNQISNSVQEILNENLPIFNPEKANTAIFYSISNTQDGLRGISFGNFLIKRVVKELKNELPNLKNFVTLSPIPGFMSWLKKQIKNNELDNIILNHFKLEKTPKSKNKDFDLITIIADIKDIIASPILFNNRYDVEYINLFLKPILEFLVVHYLYNDDKKWNNNPVLKFHLTNGAEIYRVNWLGDVSEKGYKQSLGFMVNYFYNLPYVEKHHEMFNKNKKAISYGVRMCLENKVIKY